MINSITITATQEISLWVSCEGIDIYNEDDKLGTVQLIDLCKAEVSMYTHPAGSHDPNYIKRLDDCDNSIAKLRDNILECVNYLNLALEKG